MLTESHGHGTLVRDVGSPGGSKSFGQLKLRLQLVQSSTGTLNAVSESRFYLGQCGSPEGFYMYSIYASYIPTPFETKHSDVFVTLD